MLNAKPEIGNCALRIICELSRKDELACIHQTATTTNTHSLIEFHRSLHGRFGLTTTNNVLWRYPSQEWMATQLTPLKSLILWQVDDLNRLAAGASLGGAGVGHVMLIKSFNDVSKKFTVFDPAKPKVEQTKTWKELCVSFAETDNYRWYWWRTTVATQFKKKAASKARSSVLT